MHSTHTATASPTLVSSPTATALPDAGQTPTVVVVGATPNPDPSRCSPGSNAAPLPTTFTTLYASTESGVVALNAADGSQRWSYQTGSGSYPTVTPGDGNVYVASNDAPASAAVTLRALGAMDGALRWQAQLPGDVNPGAPTARLLAGGLAVYATASDGTVRALDAVSGHTLWQAQIATGAAYSDVALVGGTVVIEFVNRSGSDSPPGAVAAVRASDGTVLWHVATTAPALMPLVVANGLVYIADTATTLVALNAATGVAHWRIDLGAAPPSQPQRNLMSVVAAGTGLYVTAGFYMQFTLLALNASTGTLCWITHGIGEGATSAPVLDGTLLYDTAFCGDPGPPDPGTECVYALDAHTGDHRWDIKVKGAYGGITPAALVNGALYVSNCPAFALRAESGATIWSDTASLFLNGFNVNLGQVQVIGATAYVAYTGGTVRALNAQDGSARWNVALSGQIAGLVAGA